MTGPDLQANGSIMEAVASVSDSFHEGTGHRSLERKQSMPRRDQAVPQLHGSSRFHKDEQKTVGEYALHVLFTSFIAQAEEKLNECMTIPFDPEPQIERICGPGVDPAFDQLIVALGHIASPKPKALIDSMMLWKKSKSDAANEARSQRQQSRNQQQLGPLLRRNTEPLQVASSGHDSGLTVNPGLLSRQEFVAQQERRSTVSIYILCRVLLEVVCQSTLPSLTIEMEEKLESIIFGQLKIADSEQLMLSPLKLANWNLFAQLLGRMNNLNFVGVTRRFIDDLDGSLQDRAAKSPTLSSNRDSEAKLDLVLGGMKHLRIKVSPESAWEDSCAFLVSLGRLFHRSRGPRVKTAFCKVLDMLLLPIAAKASNHHLIHPKWTEVLTIIGPHLRHLDKPRYWTVVFPLECTLLCVSPPETFGSNWLQHVLNLQTKVKDRYTKALCFQVISRLIWTYLYRTNDNNQSCVRKLDDVIKLIIPFSKRNTISFDPAVTEPLIQILRIIGFRYPEFCFRSVIFPLINADLFVTNRELKAEQLEPDRIVVGIRAFLSIMSDLEKGEQGRPPFPQFYDSQWLAERRPTSPLTPQLRNSPLAAPYSTLKDESICRPVLTHVLTDGVREYYQRFCQILGRITIVCDDAFGGQAAVDEKLNNSGSKTPVAETVNTYRREEHQNIFDQKHAFYELLHVAFRALPRCLSADIPFKPLINLLCTGTAHVQSQIAESSASSLKFIARHSHAQKVTMGFARFIFNFDDRYSTMSDGGMLGSTHIENTLQLYIELLQLWIEEVRQKSKDAASTNNSETSAADMRALKLDLSSAWAEVDQAEAHGLFFLCSQSRRVRHFAITVLRLITELDVVLGNEVKKGKMSPRLIDILENDSNQVMDFDDEHLSVAERSRLQRGLMTTDDRGILIDLCSSDVTYDTTLWYKVFPNLIRIAFDKCPFAVTICRDLIYNRVLQMYSQIVILSEPTRGPYYSAEPGNSRPHLRTSTTQPEVLIEQWKLYLIFACTTLADQGAQPMSHLRENPHSRKTSKPLSTDKMVTARTLFKYLIPLLISSSALVRDAVVVGMGAVNIHIYRTLLEELNGQASRCSDDARVRIQHQRTTSVPRRNRKIDLLRTEITHVLKLTSHFLKLPQIYEVEFFLHTLISYANDLKLFLMDKDVQQDWEFQKLRRHFCGLMEALFDGINRSSDPSRWITFESRKSAFSLMEDWCGFSPNQNQVRVIEDTMRQSLFDRQTLIERGTVTAAMEIEKRNLRIAALSAMAALCGGPISKTTESGLTLQFDIRRMLSWIEAIFNSGSDRINLIGRRALKNLMVENQDHPFLLEHCVSRCYLADSPKVLESYFSVVMGVVQEHATYPCPFWRLLALCLVSLGNDQKDIRYQASTVLHSLEAHHNRNSKIQDFDISVSDKTQAVYKRAQFEISKRLAQRYTELAFHIFSDLTNFLKDLYPAAQRNVIAVILPWIQTVELKLDPDGGPTAPSHVLLANLLELTIRSSGVLHNEVQAVWQALATGPHPGNVRLALDFIIQLCLERKEQNFVEYAKQIVVFLSTTNSTPSIKVVEYLLLQITPKAMVPNEKREAMPLPADISLFPYCADLSEALPVGTKQAGFSLGQLCLILLVDLMVAPVQVTQENLPLLLHVITVLWDHYTPLVQEQAREMLAHLVHELVISSMDDQANSNETESIQCLVDLIRKHDRSVVWNYDDIKGISDEPRSRVPPSMINLTRKIVDIFETAFPGTKEQWGRLSLTWATSCPVRHLACRSFQIFRCILTSLDQYMLGDMLARLSNTIADEDPEIQAFSMEILTTLRMLIIKLEPEMLLSFPQFFWTSCACLESINENEFLEAMQMLNELVEKCDLRSPSVRRVIKHGQPKQWNGDFTGVQSLLYKGLRSSSCLQATLNTLDKFVKLPLDNIVGDNNRLFFALLANFPRFVNELENGKPSVEVRKSAEILLAETDKQGLDGLGLVLDDFITGVAEDSQDFLQRLLVALQNYYLPQLEFQMITFLMGLLTNSLSWVKVQTMRILCAAIPLVDMRNSEMAGHGSDLISPLLRLLQTEYCMGALEVLDCIMTVSGSNMDRHHLRMSMTRSTSKAVRKEYERTQSLFGIPEATGWAIPVPAQKTESIRANIHAAFYTCQSSGEASTDATPTAEVEFLAEDFPYDYFDIQERADTMLSDEGRLEISLGDLMTKLDSLDDFFDEPPTSHAELDSQSSGTATGFMSKQFEAETQLYDEQILPILHEASNNVAFQNGFSDRSLMPVRDASHNTMNPGAFTAGLPQRPGLYSRSVTSPSAPANHQSHAAGSRPLDDGYVSAGGFSDADDERPDRRRGGLPPLGAPRPSRPNFRTGIRNFASLSREARRKERDAAPATPRIPENMLQKKVAGPGPI